MNNRDLIRLHPKLYHMAESGSWPSIHRHGLLSTSALLDKFEITGSRRAMIESNWRPNSIPIQHQVYGKAVIRDQKPMPPDSLQQCLVGCTAREWYELINRKTFFWVNEDRLIRLLNGFAYRNRSHTVIIVSTYDLINKHKDEITMSDINSGFVYYGGKRGRETFKRIQDFPGGHRVWELAVEYGVPDIADITVRVEERKCDIISKIIWERN